MPRPSTPSSGVFVAPCSESDLDCTVTLSLSETPTIDALPCSELIGDRYMLTSLIGEGGMGSVYKARHKVLDKDLAIKMLRPEALSDDKAVLRFQQEARAANSLNHLNLVSVYDFGVTSNGSPYLVMDYADGERLSDVIDQEGKLPAIRALSIFLQICDALAHAHSKGVIHRDIKPSNIILMKGQNGADFVKVVDFGIAKIMPAPGREAQDLTSPGQLFGSPLYMSPEQSMGRALDARSDIYSLGCVMFESLTGHPPFKGATSIETMLKHVNEAPPAIEEDIPAGLESIIDKTLRKDPDARYQSMLELSEALDAIAHGQLPIDKAKELKHESAVTGRRSALWATATIVGCLIGFVLGFNEAFQPLLHPPMWRQYLRDSLTDIQNRHPELAVATIDDAIKVARKEHASATDLAELHTTLGETYEIMAEAQKPQQRLLYTEAKNAFVKGQAEADHAGSSFQRIKLLSREADCDVRLGETSKAIALYEHAVKLMQSTEAVSPTGYAAATVYLKLSDCYLREGKTVKAEVYAKNAIRILNRVRGHDSLQVAEANQLFNKALSTRPRE